MPKDLFKEVLAERSGNTPDLFAEVLAERSKKDLFEEVAQEQKIVPVAQKKIAPTITREQFEMDPFQTYAKTLKEKKPLVDVTPLQKAFERGGRSGVSGLLMGYKPEKAPNDENWLEHLAALAGEVMSDVPGFWAGGKLGSLVGGGLGSVIPGVGTAAGAIGGGAAGAMAFPSMIKQSFQEYRDFVDKGGNLSFGDFLERAGRVSKETGKAGAVGLATAGMGKLLPFLKKIPKFDKILQTKPARVLTESALELTGLTGAQAAMEGALPTAQQVADNAAVLLGMKLTHAGSQKIKEYRYKELVEPKKTGFNEMVKDIVPDYVEKQEKYKKLDDVLRDYVGSKNAKIVESAFDWREKQATYEKDGKFTPDQLEEMIYYAQKTGNPNRGSSDSFTDVSNRLPKHAKAFVDEVVRPHTRAQLKAWNDHPLTKDIHARPGLEERYLHGVYENVTPAKMRAINAKIRTKFKIKNPFSNAKTFITYNEAAQEAGLKPRYKNIVDLMKYTDSVNIKLMHNAELLNMIRQFQDYNKENIVVTSNNPIQYAKAEAEGFIPFEDPFLRSYRDKSGTYRTTEQPALVSPEFAKVFPGVFSKEAFSPESAFWKKTDQARGLMNLFRVTGSLFHYGAITESALGERGLKALRFKNTSLRGRELLNDKKFMVQAARDGVVLNRNIEPSIKKGNALLDAGIKNIQNNQVKAGVNKLNKGMSYLFDVFIPEQKAVAYDEAITREFNKFKKRTGKSPNAQEQKAMRRVIAEHINNIFGGQNWETSKYFRDPKQLKKLRRVFAFSDWTTSAIKQVTSVLKPGLGGRMAQRYLMKYLLYTTAGSSLLRTLFRGLTQSDEKNKSIKGIRFDAKKALEGLADVKNIKDAFSFTLPDISISYGPNKDDVINLGRDEEGRRVKGHFGKQFLEMFNWLKSPLSTFFSKANPVFTTATKQALGVTPSPYGPFTVERGWYRGREVPWKGKQGVSQLVERAKSLVEEFVPFGLRGGAKQWVSTFGGLFPVSKEYTLFKAEDDIENALTDKDRKRGKEKLFGIKALLKTNNFTDKQINNRISSIKSQLKSDRYKDDIEKMLQMPSRKELLRRKSAIVRTMKRDNDLGLSVREINRYIKSIERRLKDSGKI